MIEEEGKTMRPPEAHDTVYVPPTSKFSGPGLALMTVLALIVVLIAWLISGLTGEVNADAAGESQRVTVTSVIDGDTFTAEDSTGEDLGRVRVLGIDTPEMARDDHAGECHAIEATDAAAQLLDSQTVTITRDPNQGERDQYGRLLAYVDVAGNDFGQDMLVQGHARLYDDAAGLERQDSYTEAAHSAQDRSAGLWATC